MHRVIRELRIYELFEGTEDVFHQRFRDHTLRIMGRCGFHVVAGWHSFSNGHPEFIYMLEWPDEMAMKECWAAFIADDEWAQVKRETAARHGQLVGAVEDRLLTAVDYVPGTAVSST